MKMSSKGVVSKELGESIRFVLGKNIKIPFKCAVRMEMKSDKTENKILVFSAWRLFVMAAKIPSKVDLHFHYLEIQGVDSKKPNQLCLSVGEKIYTFYSPDAESELVDRMILQLGIAIKNIFPLVPLEHVVRRVEVVPPSRIQALYDYNKTQDGKEVGPCGGFSTQYACMCDFHGLPYREEVAWDVDTIYLSHDARELSLQDFDHLEPRDLIPIIAALEFNPWFTKLRASNVRLSSEAAERILQVMKKSLSIEELYLDNMGLKWDFIQKLSVVLMANSSTPIHTIDFSNNFIEEKGAPHLVNIVMKLPKGLVHLNLAKTGLTAKGVNMLANALAVNRFMASTLTYLNLADNVLKEEVNERTSYGCWDAFMSSGSDEDGALENWNLYNFLAQPNTITHLDLSGTDVALDLLFGALMRGSSQKLSHINLSRNPFSHKKSKDVVVPTSFKQFFMSTIGLKFLNLSSTRLPPEALKNMLLGLAFNELAADVELDLSSNVLGSQGAHVLENCISDVRGLSSLDISDNSLESDLASVVCAIAKNKSLRRLAIGRNFTNIKSKHMASVMEAIVQMIQEDDSAIEHLSLADSKLKNDIYSVINALGSNQCLVSVDISGNQMGDAGARLLAKALQINNRLKALFYDRNNISASGFCDLAYALQTNYTMRFMPYPIFDACVAMKTNPERTDAALKRIENLLHRNVSPKKFSNGQAFRLQQGFLLSSTQQMVDRLVVQTQDLIKSLKYSVEETIPEDLLQAEAHIKDADKSKQLLARLQDVILQREEAGNPIDLKLTHLSDELHRVIQAHLQGTVDSMIKCAEDQCPVIMSESKLCQDLQKSCKDKSTLSSSFVRQAIVEQAGTDILNKVNELNLAVASHLSDRIIDEVIESLSKNYKGLLSVANQKQNSTPDVLRRRARFDSDASKTDGFAEKSDSPEDTPQLSNKRKSMQTRKLRPQSVVDNMDDIGVNGAPDLLPKDSKDRDTVDDLSPQRLQHLGKARPRRQKTRAPSRSNLRADTIPEDEQQNLNEGLDTFFQKSEPATPVISPSLSDDRSTEFTRSVSTSKLEKTAKEKSAAENKKGTSKDKTGDADKEKKEKGGRLVQGLSSMISRMTSDRHSKSKTSLTAEAEKPKADVEPPAVVKTKEDPEKEAVPVPDPVLCQPAAIPKVGVGGNILAEMKARQEKRLSLHKEQKEAPEKEKGLPLSPKLPPPSSKSPTYSGGKSTNGIVTKIIPEREDADSLTCPPASPGWKPKSDNLAAKLVDELAFQSKPPTATSPLLRPVSSPLLSKNPEPGSGSKSSDLDAVNSPSSKRSMPPKPRPPPIAPKPRPRSMISPETRKSGDFSPGSDVSSMDGSTGTTPERGDRKDDSVDSGLMGSRDSLSPQDLTPDPSSPLSDADSAKRKAQSLPRNVTADMNIDSTSRSRSMSCKEPLRMSSAEDLTDSSGTPRRPMSTPSTSPQSEDSVNNESNPYKESAFHVDDVVNV